jgi:hypothetical protein
VADAMIWIQYGKEDKLWTVGVTDFHNREWTPLRDFADRNAAACYVNWLNGGNGEPFRERISEFRQPRREEDHTD